MDIDIVRNRRCNTFTGIYLDDLHHKSFISDGGMLLFVDIANFVPLRIENILPVM